METKTGRNDPLLGALFAPASEGERARAMDELLTAHVYWRIDRILSARFAQSALVRHDRDDIRNEILVRLVDRLHALGNNSSTAIESFPDYVSVVAFNTFDEFVKRVQPLRARLRNRVRYALRHDRRLAMWDAAGSTLCGLSAWKGACQAADPAASPPRLARRPTLAAFLTAMFEEIGRPLRLDDAVTFVADVHDATDPRLFSLVGDERAALADPIERLADLQVLHKLWREICELPLRQRLALLLNARDDSGESVVRFLPVTGIASIRQIGESLAIQARELAELWHELPLEDARIAVILNVSRQQVINLRRTARQRLHRRMHRC